MFKTFIIVNRARLSSKPTMNFSAALLLRVVYKHSGYIRLCCFGTRNYDALHTLFFNNRRLKECFKNSIAINQPLEVLTAPLQDVDKRLGIHQKTLHLIYLACIYIIRLSACRMINTCNNITYKIFREILVVHSYSETITCSATIEM